MAHRFERLAPNPEPLVKLTDDLSDAEVRVWVDYTPHGHDDLCLVFSGAGEFRAWLEELLSEAQRQEILVARPNAAGIQ
jgi:hypothetical protein